MCHGPYSIHSMINAAIFSVRRRVMILAALVEHNMHSYYSYCIIKYLRACFFDEQKVLVESIHH